MLGIVSAGTTAGMLLPPLAASLIDTLGWRGARRPRGWRSSDAADDRVPRSGSAGERRPVLEGPAAAP